MSENKNSEEPPNISRKEFLKFATLVTASSALNTACNRLKQLPPTPTPYPPTPTTENTPTPESAEIKEISASGRIEINPENPSIERLRFHFPEEIIEGNSPLIPIGDFLSVSFDLESESPITNLDISASELFGIKTAKLSMVEDTSTVGAIDTSYITETMQKISKNSEQFLQIDDKSKEVMNKIELRYGLLPNKDKLRVVLILPNENYSYTDNEGGHIENPAKRFLSGEMGLGIKRRGDIEQGTVIVDTIGLVAKDVNLYNAGTRTHIAEANDVNFNSTKKMVITSDSIESKDNESKQEEESKWTTKEWEPDEKVPLREWWNDMTSKGYIKVDSIAKQFGGDSIYDVINNSHLVPNPQEYHTKGHPFIGNCNTSLDRLVRDGKGHISISSEAYSQIPGADNCQVFSNNK